MLSLFLTCGPHPHDSGIVDTYLAANFFSVQARLLARRMGDTIGGDGAPRKWIARTLDAAVQASGPLLLRTVDAAASTVMYAALAPATDVAGRYVVPRARTVPPDPAALEPARAVQLWDYATQLAGLDIDPSLR